MASSRPTNRNDEVILYNQDSFEAKTKPPPAKIPVKTKKSFVKNKSSV